MVMGKKNSSTNLFDWLNRYRNIYAYIYIKRIRRMDMKCSWMPKFDGQNKDNTHMHTYTIIYYIVLWNIYELNLS